MFAKSIIKLLCGPLFIICRQDNMYIYDQKHSSLHGFSRFLNVTVDPNMNILITKPESSNHGIYIASVWRLKMPLRSSVTRIQVDSF